MEYQFTNPYQSRLRLSYYCLLQLEKSICETSEEGLGPENPEEPTPEMFRQKLDAMLSTLESILDMPKSLRFSCLTSEDLSKLNIRLAGYLALRSDCRERVATTISLGEDELWSSPNLYRHLQSLEKQIPRRTVGSGRAWIEAFLFRVSAMLKNRCMILNNESDKGVQLIYWRELVLQGSSLVSGSADYYTAVLEVKADPELLFMFPTLHHILNFDMPLHSGFLTIVEGESLDPCKHVPRALMEMYTCGMNARLPKILRGALTNGRQWIFILMKFDDDYNNALYIQSEVIQMVVTRDLNGEVAIHEPFPDLIAAILAHWIENGSSDFGNDDWFELACRPTL